MTLTITLLLMTLHMTINKKHVCNLTFVNVISKVIMNKVFISIDVLSKTCKLRTKIYKTWRNRVKKVLWHQLKVSEVENFSKFFRF
jgi:hypothetical protein